MGAALTLTGEVQYGTPMHHLPLPPPPVPGRVAPQFNGRGQYLLPGPPGTDRTLRGYARASTIAKTLEDTWMLDRWARRMVLIGLQRSLALQADLDQLIARHLSDGGNPDTIAADLRRELNDLSETAQHRAGATYAAEFGTAVHAWCEWVDLGLGTVHGVPERFRPWVLAHRRQLAESCLTVEPDWTERIVLNTRYGIAGTLDRVFRDAEGRLVLGDIKTSKGMDYSWLYFAVQLGIYHTAEFVLSLDGTTWEPMPELVPDYALISHLPSIDPAQSRVVPLSMEFGARALHTAMVVRSHRARAEKEAQNVHYAVRSEQHPVRRYHLARYHVETSQTEAELAEVWERYQDVWTDDLTELGWRTIQSLPCNATPRN